MEKMTMNEGQAPIQTDSQRFDAGFHLYVDGVEIPVEKEIVIDKWKRGQWVFRAIHSSHSYDIIPPSAVRPLAIVPEWRKKFGDYKRLGYVPLPPGA